MFKQLQTIQHRPELYSVYTTDVLWCEPHLANQMLQTHLNQDTTLASRPLSAINRVVSWFDDTFQLSGKALCDLGCGPGLYAQRFAQRGAMVQGLDFSTNSIAYARQNSTHGVTYEVANYLTDPLPQNQDLITLIYCDLCVLSPAQRQVLYTNVRASLKPEGRFVFDVMSAGAFEGVSNTSTYGQNYMGGFWATGDYFAFHNTFRYDVENVSLDHFTIIEEGHTWHVYNWLKYFTAQNIKRELAQNGFSIDKIVPGFDVSSNDEVTFGVIAQPLS